MKRKALLLAMTVAIAMSAFAQRIVESTEEFVSYDRNSISVIMTKYNDQFDNVFVGVVNSFDFGNKFDINNIETKTMKLNHRYVESNQMMGLTYTPDKATVNSVLANLNTNNVGKEILAYILGRDAQGQFKRDLINQRGEWNATDKDYIESKATQVDAMGQNGEILIGKSYIIVFDMKNPTRKESKAKDNKGREYTIVTWSAEVGAMVFQIANAEQVVAHVLTNMWIYEKDSASIRDAKKRAFDELQVKMELVATAGVKSSAKELGTIIANSKDRLIHKLENQIAAWQVTIDCETVEPFITAKIGKKEGVRNTQRFGIYGQVYNNKKECLEFKRKGYVRATVVADNRRVADGTADSTYFYRISGGSSLNGTEILKQRNDLGIGISANFNNNGSFASPTKNRTFGSFSYVDFGIDYLAFMHKRGFSHYLMVGLGLDKFSGENLEKGHQEFGEYADALDSEGEFLFKNGGSYLNVSLGYMFGIKIKQFLEIQPFIKGGIDMVSTSPAVEEETLKDLAVIEDYTIQKEEDLKKSSSSWYLDPGIRLTFNVVYPVQLYLQANYSIGFGGGDKYNILNKYFTDCGYGHTNGLGVGGGIRIML